MNEPEPVIEPPMVETMPLPDNSVFTAPAPNAPTPPPVIGAEPELAAVAALRGQAQLLVRAWRQHPRDWQRRRDNSWFDGIAQGRQVLLWVARRGYRLHTISGVLP